MKWLITATRRAWKELCAIRYRRHAALALIIAEGLITAVPFVISWLLSATYKAVLAGWAVSGMTTSQKRVALRRLMGEGQGDDAG